MEDGMEDGMEDRMEDKTEEVEGGVYQILILEENKSGN